jgi:hypothetical protein
MRFEVVRGGLLVTRFDEVGEIFGKLFPLAGVGLGELGSNEGTLSSKESSSLAKGGVLSIVGDGQDVGKSFIIEETLDSGFVDLDESFEKGVSKIFFGLGDSSFVVHSLNIS